MKKLIIQIPCLNEEHTLKEVIENLPRKIDGIDLVEILVIDDNSTDDTANVGRTAGAEHILTLHQNNGLARAFSKGLEEAVCLGADVIVNTDGDSQYVGADVERLIAKMRESDADIVVGCRDISSNKDFSMAKKILQVFGSIFVSFLSNIKVPDTTSGFRAYSKEAALRLTVQSSFTYTLETLIQARVKGLSVETVPIRVNEKKRDSRLFSGITEYLSKSAATIVRVVIAYRPLIVFNSIALATFGTGFLLGCRFLYYFFFLSQGEGRVQSLILAALLMIIGVQSLLMGLGAYIASKNRLITEEVLYLERKRCWTRDSALEAE